MEQVEFELHKKPLNMAHVLEAVEKLIPELLKNRDGWNSLLIDYQPPHLMRLYRQVGPIRINLHYFLPTKIILTDAEDANLYHPHAWASCMRILDGQYSQWIGFANRRGLNVRPEKTLHLVHNVGDTYAMNHPWLWHQVIPFPNRSVSTLMVTYIPDNWDQDPPFSPIPLRRLDGAELDFMFEHFKKFY